MSNDSIVKSESENVLSNKIESENCLGATKKLFFVIMIVKLF